MHGCLDGGCVRWHDRCLEKQGHIDEMSDPAHRAGQALDRCVCVHAEQYAFPARRSVPLWQKTEDLVMLPLCGRK